MRSRITSPQNARVKDAVRLRSARTRQKRQQIIIDGAREIARARAAGVHLAHVFVCPELLDSAACEQLIGDLDAAGVEVLLVSDAVFAKIAYGNREEGIVAVAEMPVRNLAEFQPGPNPLVAVLEAVEKPGNLGAIARSADGAGVSALILADPVCDPFNPNAIRASLGAIFQLPLFVAGGDETQTWLEQRGLTIFAARVDGRVAYHEADFRGPSAIILGSESEGLSQRWRRTDCVAIALPMRGVGDSLNVSVTAAILFYEALRQRTN
jgi:TrmH family RNA methyltransferase